MKPIKRELGYLDAQHRTFNGTPPNVPQSFKLSDTQIKQITEWQIHRMKIKDPHLGNSDGRFSYHFYPTNVGYIVKVEDGVSGVKEDFTDYDTW
jgi:hypothetical protein